MLRALRDFNRRRKYGPPVIVVSGLPRSGTSMMMNMLRAADLEIDTSRLGIGAVVKVIIENLKDNEDYGE